MDSVRRWERLCLSNASELLSSVENIFRQASMTCQLWLSFKNCSLAIQAWSLRWEMCAIQLGIVGQSNQVCLIVLCHTGKFLCTCILGFQGSTTPRLGDGAVAAQILGATARGGVDNLGTCNLFRGTADIGTMRVVDSGYVNLDRNTAAANARAGNPSLQDWCRRVK